MSFISPNYVWGLFWAEVTFLWCLLLLFYFLDPGAILSSTTSVAWPATLVLIATDIGGGSTFGDFAGLVFRDAQNPPFFDFDCKNYFLRFVRVSRKMVGDLSCFSFSLTMCQRWYEFLSWGYTFKASWYINLCCSLSSRSL